jgi:hypothetical protein
MLSNFIAKLLGAHKMITAVDQRTYEFRGLSTDKKPIKNVGNGSVFFEMDTLKVFIFDEKSKKWIELANAGK